MKYALVLEGGGMRSLYTCGVTDYLIEKNVEFNSCIGVSAGACVGSSFVAKQFGRAAQVNLDYMDDKEYFSIRNLLKDGSAFDYDYVFNRVPNKENLFDYATFHNNPCKFYAVSTNIETGKPVYKRIIDIRKDIEYIESSISLPLISNIMDIDDQLLLDGGISDPIPVEFAFKSNDKCVVVLTQSKDYRKSKESLLSLIKVKYKDYPNLIRLIEERHVFYNRTLDYLYWLEKEGKAFIIQPQEYVDLSRLETNKDKLRDLYNKGYQDTERLYNQLVQFMNE